MKAVSVKQPWAALIVHFDKRTENRSWPTRYRGDLVICASARVEDMESTGWMRLAKVVGLKDAASGILTFLFTHRIIVRGAAIGVVRVVGCDQDMRTAWDEPGQWHWRFDNVRPFAKPIPIKGRLGLFDIDDRLVAEALNSPERAPRPQPC